MKSDSVGVTAMYAAPSVERAMKPSRLADDVGVRDEAQRGCGTSRLLEADKIAPVLAVDEQHKAAVCEDDWEIGSSLQRMV